jgi:hypothetical protein
LLAAEEFGNRPCFRQDRDRSSSRVIDRGVFEIDAKVCIDGGCKVADSDAAINDVLTEAVRPANHQSFGNLAAAVAK